jgi:nucleotide-binding universal stress UspA family protein
MVAVSSRITPPEQTAALQATVRLVAAAIPESRVALVTVIPPPPVFGTSDPAESGGNAHIRELVELRHWAVPLGLVEGRCTCHVLEDDDVATAILNYARINRVDQIVIGAPPMVGGPHKGIAYAPHPGAVAPRIALFAGCSVILVRAPGNTAGA